MSSFEELSARLSRQFLEAPGLVLPAETLSEAFLSALGRLNSFLGRAYTLAGLGGAVETSLPEELVPALMAGAAAGAADYALRQRLTSFSKALGGTDGLESWATHLSRQFDALLERARSLSLQSEGGLPYSAWPWVEKPGWRS